MADLVKIAVDAMGGDGSPKKTIDGIVHNHLSHKNNFYKIFGDEKEIYSLLDNKKKNLLCKKSFSSQRKEKSDS